MRLRILASLTILIAACGGDPVVPVDATPDADQTDALDLAAPDTMITMSPALLTNTRPARFEFTASEAATFRCRIDGGAPTDCSSPQMINGLVDGNHAFEVRAIDTSNNEDPSPATFAWRIDTEAPETVLTVVPPQIDNSTTTAIEFEAPGEVGATFECGLDGAVFAACTSPYTAMDLLDGNHVFRVRAKDAAGNFDQSAALHNWEVDSVSPDTVIDTGPAGVVGATTATFTFSSPGAGAGATFACHLDNAPFGPCLSPRTFVGLADGAHTFEVRVTDVLGNTDPSPARRQWSIDSTGPVTSITVRPDNPSSDLTPTFEFTANEPSTFECQIDGQVPYAPCASPYTAPAVAAGTRFFRIRATDAINNRGAEATYEWVIDAAGPVTTITGGPDGPVASTTATFNWNTTEPATFCYRFTGDAADTCTAALAGSGTVTRPGLMQGAQTFTVTATDGLGNVGAPAVRNFSVDTIGPAVMITVGPSNTVATVSNPFTFTSPEPATFCHKVDTLGEVCTATPALTSSVTINAPDGAHTLDVVARDALGNRTAVPATRAWTVDTQRPATTIMTGPVQGSTLDTGDATVDLTSSEPSTICWRINGGAETCSAAGAAAFTATLTGQADGVINFTARASDAIGFGPTVCRTWTVDTVRPTVMITGGPAMGATVGQADTTFAITSSEPATICWQFNALPQQCSAAGVVTFSPGAAALPQGVNTFAVFARDLIGDGATVNRSWTIDSVRPTMTITAGPGAGTTTASNIATFTVTSSEAATICWRFGGGAEACSAAGVMMVDAISPALPDGGALFEAYGRDSVGTGVSIQRTWTIDTARPTIAITAGPAAASFVGSNSASFSLIASERSTICWQFNAGAAVCTAPGQTNAVATATGLPEGATTFSVTGADAVGVGAATVRNWTVDTVRPVVSITAGPNEGQRINAVASTVSVSATESSTICYRLDGAAEQCSAAGVASFDIMLAGLTQGDHTLAIYARDAVGVGPTLTRNFIVDSIRPTVTITAGPGEGSTVSSTTANFSIASSEASTICWKFNGGAETCSGAGALTASASAVGLPQGATTLEVRASDSVGTGATVTRNWTVDTTRPTVTITAGPAQGSISGANNSSFTVTATEPSTICWRFNTGGQTCSAPAQMSVTFQSGPLPQGSNVIAVEGRDGFGPGTSVVRTWTIDTIRPTVSITAGPAAGALLDSNAASFTLHASEPSMVCWRFNAGAEVCSPPGRVDVTAATTGLPQGLNTITFHAEDGVGAGPNGTRSWTVDTLPPVITISAPPAQGATINSTTANFAITTNEPATICWKLDGGAETCSAAHAMSINANLALLAAGNHALVVSAVDDVANPSTLTRNWSIDLLPPLITISAPPAQNASTNATTASFTLSTNEPATICWTLDAMGPATCSAPDVLSFSANLNGLTVGAHALVVTAVDVATNQASTTRNWTVDNSAPVVTISAPPAQNAFTNSVTAAFTISSSKPATICWALDGGAQTCSAAGQNSFVANLAALTAGAHALVAVATDNATNQGTLTRNWTVDLTAPVVTIGAPPAQNAATNATTANFALTTNEPSTICWVLDGGAQTCSAAGQVAFGTGNLNGLAVGPHALVVTGTDTAGNPTNVTRNWTIDTTAPTITFSTPPAEGAAVLQSSNPNITITTNEPATICWKLDGGAQTCSAPGVMSFATGPLAGLSVAAHAVVATATDPATNLTTATRNFSIAAGKMSAPDADSPAIAWPLPFYDGVVSAWVRDPGQGAGDVLSFATATGTCTLRGAWSMVALDCEAGGVALPPAYGFLGSMAKSDGGWHFVTVAFEGDRVELWIDDQLVDTTSGPAMTGRGIVMGAATSSYELAEITVDRL